MSTAATSGPADAGTIGFSDLLTAELTKIRTLPATWIAMAVACTLNTLLGILASTDVVRLAGRDGPIPVTQLDILVLAPVYVHTAIAVFAMGSEYRGGQLRVSLAAVPDRNRLATAKLVAAATVSLVVAIPVLVPGHLIRHAGEVVDGDPGIGRAAVELGALLAVYVLMGLIGYGFAGIVRTVVTPLAVLFSAPILLSPVLRRTVPDVVRFLPHEAAVSLLDLPTHPSAALDRIGGLLVLTGWAGAFVGAARTAFARRDS